MIAHPRVQFNSKSYWTTIVFHKAGSGMKPWSRTPEFNSILNHIELRSFSIKQDQVWSRDRAPLNSIQFHIILNYDRLQQANQGQVWSRDRAPLSSIQFQIILNYDRLHQSNQGQVWSRDRAPLSSIQFKLIFSLDRLHWRRVNYEAVIAQPWIQYNSKSFSTTILFRKAGSGMKPWSRIHEFNFIPNILNYDRFQ